ncbi:hypothetical protein SBY92_005397 [Candida maltosa Xu316]
MAPPKRHWVKLKLSSKFLGTLPEFPTYISKSRLKKLAQEERRSGSTSINTSQRSSPVPEGGAAATTNTSSGPTIINMGLKEGSTSGLTMNSIASGQYALDKSGKSCKRWIKKPRQFKTFTGFKVTYVEYEPKDKEPEVKIEEKIDEESSNVSTLTNTPGITPSVTPVVKVEP